MALQSPVIVSWHLLFIKASTVDALTTWASGWAGSVSARRTPVPGPAASSPALSLWFSTFGGSWVVINGL